MIIAGETKFGFCGAPIIEGENDHLYIPNYMYSENDPLEQVRDSYCHIHCLSERGLGGRAKALDEAYTKSPPPNSSQMCPLLSILGRGSRDAC